MVYSSEKISIGVFKLTSKGKYPGFYKYTGRLQRD